MEAATLSQQAWEKHRQASAQFEKKQKIMHDYLRSLNKHITKARLVHRRGFFYFLVLS